MLAGKRALADIREHFHFVDDKTLLDTVLDHLWACESVAYEISHYLRF
jgi:hypothetical protein